MAAEAISGPAGDAAAPPEGMASRLTSEELNVLRECARESFFYRCLPLAAVGCFGVKYLQLSGLLRSHPVYGLSFKYAAAVGIGYFIGKLSYFKECQRKVMERIPNSNLAESIRRRARGNATQYNAVSAVVGTPNQLRYELRSNNVHTNGASSSDQGLATNQDGSNNKTAKMNSYEQMREKNRMDFMEQLQKKFIRRNEPISSSVESNAPESVSGQNINEDDPTLYRPPEPKKGKYGDEGFD